MGDWFDWLWNEFLNNIIRIDETLKTTICFVCFLLALISLVNIIKKGMLDKDGKDFNIKKVGVLNYLILILSILIMVMYITLQ